MARSPVPAVRRFLEAISLTHEPRPAAEWLVDIAVGQGWESDPNEAREWAERVQGGFIALLRRELDALNAVGRPAMFAFNSSSDYMVQGAAFVEPRDDDDVRLAKERRAHLSAYESALRELTPGEFEVACGKLLGLFGVQRIWVTRLTRDDGIDFYGVWSLEARLFPGEVFPTLGEQIRIWLVGQAKRYRAGSVSTPDIREMVGSIDIARAQALGGDQLGHAEFRPRLCDPVSYMFLTTGSISPSAWSLMGRSGVIGMDGGMLAAFLAARGVALLEGTFDQSRFSQWLQEREAPSYSP